MFCVVLFTSCHRRLVSPQGRVQADSRLAVPSAVCDGSFLRCYARYLVLQTALMYRTIIVGKSGIATLPARSEGRVELVPAVWCLEDVSAFI